MKRLLLAVLILFILTISGGCNTNGAKVAEISPTVNPISPEATELPEATLATPTEQTSTTLKLTDFFPIQADAQYVYEGEGNEYASYSVYTDFVNTAAKKVQTRTDNGGTQTVRVIEIKGSKVSVINIVNECYYRDNFMNKAASGNAEVLLMEPLTKGTKWTLPDGRQRYISSVNTSVTTPLGSFNALEVTTQEKDGTTRDYYASRLGLVKSEYSTGELKVSSSLKELSTGKPLLQMIDVYYPTTDKKIKTQPMTLSYQTNDSTGEVLVKALRREVTRESNIALVSDDTTINRLHLGDDGIVYVDFSSDLIKDMKAGTDYESLILQCITNTLGNYYGVRKVCITVDKKPYISKDIKQKEGDTFQVNMDLVTQ